MQLIFGLVSLIAILIVYFIPSYIATKRNHHNKNAIIVLNILAGWTFIGYIAALVWSLTNPATTTKRAARSN